MSFKKFKPNDVLINTMEAHPRCEFFIYDAKIWHNDTPAQTGEFSAQLRGTPGGCANLYEYNIDRTNETNPFIYSFITKNSSRTSFQTAGATTRINEWLTASANTALFAGYPLSASISRELIPVAKSSSVVDIIDSSVWYTPANRHYYALKNRLNYLGAQSQHYLISSSMAPGWIGCKGQVDENGNAGTKDCNGWDKDKQAINLISIPSIFYGEKINPGSVSLKWYVTGTLAGELRDIKRNGELIQVSGAFSASAPGMLGGVHTSSVAGVVLYNEGFILLTGSWALNDRKLALQKDLTYRIHPSWLYFGAGALDGVNSGSTDANITAWPPGSAMSASLGSASFGLSFEGITQTQVVTMFTHARRGEANYSNNPTFLQYSQSLMRHTSSVIYEENPDRYIKNTVSSSFAPHSASFKRQVYISRVAIYDENKNLMGVATLANPVLKKEDQDISFKIKIDM